MPFTLRSLMISTLTAALTMVVGLSAANAQEVPKGEIPAPHVAKTLKVLPWGAAAWDAPEAITALKKKVPALWVDTRPASFFNRGTVRGAVLLSYDQAGKPKNTLTKAAIEAAIAKAGLPANAKLVFFCQGPKCHRSYNASLVAIKTWGVAPERVIWFRGGFPALQKAVQADAKLLRKAKRYLSESAIKGM